MEIRHDAFISYNHGADGRLAKALEEGLEKLAKPLLTLRAIDAFRDETSLAANPSLWAEIVEHLSGSGWLLVLACPEWAKSPWCMREAAWWLENRPSGRMLIVLSGGDLVWDGAAGDFDWQRTTALAPELRGRFHDEPLYVDLRWARGRDGLTLRNLGFRDAVLNLSAPIRGVRKDELDGADVRQLRRNRMLVRFGVAAIAIMAAVAVWQAIVATQQRDEAVRQARIALGRQLAAEAAAASAQRADLLPFGLLLGIESMRQFASGEADQTIRRGLALLPRELKTLQHDGAAVGLAVAPGGNRFATIDAHGVVRVWNPEGERAYEIAGQNYNEPQIVFSPDGKILATVDHDGHARLWDAGTGTPKTPPPVGQGRIAGMAFGLDGETLAVSYMRGNGEVAVSNVGSGTLARSLQLQHTTEHSRGLAYGRFGLAATAYSEVRFWDAGTWKERPLAMPPASIAQLAFSPDGTLLAVATRAGGRVRVFGAEDGRPVAALEMGAELTAVAFSPDGKHLAGAGVSAEARIWDTESWKQTIAVRHDGRQGKINALAFNPSGSQLATASSDHTAALWDIGSGEKRASMDHGGPVLGVGFVADGNRVITAGADGTVRIWEADASADVARFPFGDGGTIAFLPQRIVAIDGRGQSALSVRVPEGRLDTIGFPDKSGPAALFADGQLAVPGPDRVLRIDMASARELAPLTYGGDIDWDEFLRRARKHLSAREANFRREQAEGQGARMPVAFSSDGRYLVAARADFLARVWDLQTGRLLLAEPFEWDVTSAAFAPNGLFLALVTDHASLQVFALPEGRKVLTADGTDLRQALVGPGGEFVGVVERALPQQDFIRAEGSGPAVAVERLDGARRGRAARRHRLDGIESRRRIAGNGPQLENHSRRGVARREGTGAHRKRRRDPGRRFQPRGNADGGVGRRPADNHLGPAGQSRADVACRQ